MKYRQTIIILICIFASCRTIPPTTVLKANYWFSIGQYENAIEYYNMSLKKKMISDETGLVNFKLGECYRLSLDTIISLYYETAIDQLKQGSDWRWRKKTKVEKYDILLTLAFAYYNLDNYNQASNWFSHAIKVHERIDSTGLVDQTLTEKYVLSLRKLGMNEKADSVVNGYFQKQKIKLEAK
jgi:tetratricopeptide (TPR) repeat protein